MTRLLITPIVVTVLVLALIFAWGGFSALFLAILLCILEITLSFDNAVVNAKVLTRMNALWQKRFLTWGVLFAVVGTRFILPIIIVATAAVLSPLTVMWLAFTDPNHYSELLEGSGPAIGAFGGAFLLMVSLKYFFDTAKEIHWIKIIERHLARWGRVEAIEIALVLSIILILSKLAYTGGASVLTAGIVGVVLFIIMQGTANAFSVETKALAGGSIMLFVYLNVLDSAFSLDGVIGAFAITKDLPIIIAGLGIGAYFVRTLTIILVKQKTLESFPYLEHGAHWAILGLAISMLIEVITPIPEAITAFVGITFIALAYISSIRERTAKIART